jgi:hypothetical protein
VPPTDPISGKMVRKKETELAEDQAEAARNREDDGLNASKPPLQLVCCRPFSHKSTEFNQLDQSIFVGQMLLQIRGSRAGGRALVARTGHRVLLR